VFSVLSAPRAAHATMDTTEEMCFLCGPCLYVISRIVSAVQLYKRLKLGGGQAYDRSSD
jgi:hypothetical protein